MSEPNEDDLRVAREIAQRFVGSGDNIIERETRCTEAIARALAEQREKRPATWNQFVVAINSKYPRLPLYDTESCKRYVKRAVKFLQTGHVD